MGLLPLIWPCCTELDYVTLPIGLRTSVIVFVFIGLRLSSPGEPLGIVIETFVCPRRHGEYCGWKGKKALKKAE